MVYPRDIIEFVNSDSELTERFPCVASTRDLNIRAAGIPASDLAFEHYMLHEGYQHSRAIRRYLHFLSSTYDTFLEVLKYFPKVNTNSTHQDDVRAYGTIPYELFYHAMYLYCLDSWDVEGDVIECGTYKGFSACCLSWVCEYLGKKLIVADSFEGLPENTTDPYYKKGDFCGKIEEVRSNIEDFGRLAHVEFVKGFYESSLNGFSKPLCMIWIDVDLYESTIDILKNLLDQLSPRGVIISHELFSDRDFEGNKLKPTLGPSKAFHDYFEEKKISYKAIPLENGSGLIYLSDGIGELQISVERVQYIRDHCKYSDDLLAEKRETQIRHTNHWKNEIDKLMAIYHSTLDYKAKSIAKNLLGKFGLYERRES